MTTLEEVKQSLLPCPLCQSEVLDVDLEEMGGIWDGVITCMRCYIEYSMTGESEESVLNMLLNGWNRSRKAVVEYEGEDDTLRCENCDSVVNIGDVYCSHCGRVLEFPDR